MSKQNTTAETKPLSDFLGGYKTYIVGGLTIIVAVAEAMGYPVPPAAIEVLVGLGLISLRSGVKREASKVNDNVAG